MTLKDSRQSENSLNRDILDKFLSIKEIKNEFQVGIARRLGYKKDVFSLIQSGNYKGSTQLLAAVTLLLENLRMSKRIEELEQAIRVNQSVTGPLAMNERKADKLPSIGHKAGREQLDENFAKRERKAAETDLKRRSGHQS